MNFEEAAKKWVNMFNAFPRELYQKAYRNLEDDGLELLSPQKVKCLGCSTNFTLKNDDHEADPICPECGSGEFYHSNSDYFPMWSTMWSMSEKADEEWLMEHAEEVSEIGFTVFYSEEIGPFIGIDGSGVDFYEKLWIPLYKLRGLSWHDYDYELIEKGEIPNKLLNKAVNVFGVIGQLDIANEELAELSQALCETILGIGDKDNLIEEIADVEIILKELYIVFEVHLQYNMDDSRINTERYFENLKERYRFSTAGMTFIVKELNALIQKINKVKRYGMSEEVKTQFEKTIAAVNLLETYFSEELKLIEIRRKEKLIRLKKMIEKFESGGRND